MSLDLSKRGVLTAGLKVKAGLYALEYTEKPSDSSPVISVSAHPRDDSHVELIYLNSRNDCILQPGEMAIINAATDATLLASYIGLKAGSAKLKVKLVRLDRLDRAAIGQSPRSVQPNSPQLRWVSKIVDLAAGAYLFTNPVVGRLRGYPLASIQALNEPKSRLLIAGRTDTSTIEPGSHAFFVSTQKTSILITIEFPAELALNDIRVSVEPVKSAMARFAKRQKPISEPVDTAKSEEYEFQGLRVEWKDRPAGLNISAAIRNSSSQIYSPGVLSGTWARIQPHHVDPVIRLALLGPDRKNWSISTNVIEKKSGKSITYHGDVVEIEVADVEVDKIELSIVSEINKESKRLPLKIAAKRLNFIKE